MKQSSKYQKTRNPQRKPQDKGKFTKRKQGPKDSPVCESDVINDVQFYIHTNGEVLNEQLNTYSFDSFLGVPTDLGLIQSIPQDYGVGNLMQLRCEPSVSFTSETNPIADGVNVEGLRTYTKLSAQNGKTTQYGPQDVTILLLAIGSVLTNFSHGARALGICGTYNYRNRSYPRNAVLACGFDIDDIKPNIANYRTMYNYLVHRFNQIPIPKDIKYFDKCSKLYSSVYLDEMGSQMSQSYALVPGNCWVFNEAYNSNGSGLDSIAVYNTFDPQTSFTYRSSFGAFLGIIEQQINALLSSATLNYIYSDILRLHNKDNMPLLVLEDIPFNYSLIPAKVEELSVYINNAVILPQGAKAAAGNVGTHYFTKYNDVESSVNDNSIIYRPLLKFAKDYTGFTPLLNFKHDAPSTEEKVWATRFHHQVITEFDSGEGWFATDVTLTDVYISRIAVCTGTGDSGTLTEFNVLGANAVGNNPVLWLKLIGLLSQFDWHPYMYAVDDTGANVAVPISILGDTQYYTNINFEVLNRIDDVAMMALLEVR